MLTSRRFTDSVSRNAIGACSPPGHGDSPPHHRAGGRTPSARSSFQAAPSVSADARRWPRRTPGPSCSCARTSPRIVAALAALTGELLLFLLQLQPHVDAAGLAADHAQLVHALERDGPGVLRGHLRASAETLGAA